MKAEEAIKRIQDHMEVHHIGKGRHIHIKEALDMAISALREQEDRRWIPVKERLPEKNKEVVGWYKDNPFSPFRYGIVSWNGHGWVFTYAQRYVDAVTYWMPLPEPPEEDV